MDDKARVPLPEFELVSCPTLDYKDIKKVHYDLGNVKITRVKWWKFITRFKIWRYGFVSKRMFRTFTIKDKIQ